MCSSTLFCFVSASKENRKKKSQNWKVPPYYYSTRLQGSIHTVDGRNPAPVDRYFIPFFTRSYTFQVVQDLFHQQYQMARRISVATISLYIMWVKNYIYTKLHHGWRHLEKMSETLAMVALPSLKPTATLFPKAPRGVGKTICCDKVQPDS